MRGNAQDRQVRPMDESNSYGRELRPDFGPLRLRAPDGLGKLDTSLKRHTALLVKLRSSLNQQAAIPALLKEISQLALEKYVEEAVGAVVEGLGKCKTAAEVNGAIEVCTLLRSRRSSTGTGVSSC